jgi:hypothetical protein
MPDRACVALIRTAAATALRDYERVMALAGFRRYLDPTAPTILKVAQSRHFAVPSANTTPWQIEGVARALRKGGYHELVCFHSAPGRIGAFKGHDLNGYLPVLRSNRIAPGADGVLGSLWGANIVLLPTLRTDAAATIGGAMWSATTARPPASRARALLVDALALLRERSAGIFAVMDGTTAGNGPGPYRLAPEVRGVVLASADPVALDAAAARLLGLNPLRDVSYLRLAHERGLGVADPREIALVGDADLARERWSFSAGRGPRMFGWGALGRLAARTPLAYLLAIAAESYHDYYRWPSEERQVFESWLRGTEWGRLFARYQRLNTGGEARSAVSGDRKE